MNTQWFSLTHALQQTMHVVQTAVRTSLRGLPQRLALLFQPVAMVQPLGFQPSQTIVQKFLSVRKDKILENQKITGDQLWHSPFWFIFRSPDERERNANWLFGLCAKCNAMEWDVEQFAPSWWGEQHDWQWPGAASCPFSATFVATDNRAVFYFNLQCRKLFLSQKISFICSTCIFSPVLVLVAFPPCFSLLLPCSFTPRWIPKD